MFHSSDPLFQPQSVPLPQDRAVAAEDFQKYQQLEYQLVQLQHHVAAQDDKLFELQSLLQSGKGLSHIHDLKTLLEAFMAIVREKYGFAYTAILLKDTLDLSQAYYRVRAFYGLPEQYRHHHSGLSESLYMFRFPKDQGLLWQLVEQGCVFSVRNNQRQPRFEKAWQQWNLGVLQSDIWCPLTKNGEVLGILCLGVGPNGLLPTQDMLFLQELAAMATMHIDATLKYERTEQVLKNLQTLYDINQHIANVNDFKHLCIEALSSAVEALGAQRGNLMIYNKSTNQLEVSVVWGNVPERIRDQINHGLLQTRPYAMGEGIAGQSALQRKAIRVNDRSQIPQLGDYDVYCMASVPIVYGNTLEGVINMTNKVSKDPVTGQKKLDPLGRFTEEDMALLKGLADQAAMNLYKTRLYSAAVSDKLTGLYNRRYFEQYLSDCVADAAQNNTPLVLAMMDIDWFKKVNDRYGHPAGDEVLRHVARLLRLSCREQDVVFRYGGEEFCMVLPQTTPEEAWVQLQQCKERLAASPLLLTDVPEETEAVSLSMTLSMGLVALSEVPQQSTRGLLALADKRLYEAKRQGRNCIVAKD